MPSNDTESTFTAFAGLVRVAAGTRDEMVARLRAHGDDSPLPLVFDDRTGEQVDLDLRDAAAAPEVAEEHGARSVGRPRLGVVAREVTLLPRHWDWLSRQPGGASVALRRLIDEARRVNAGADGQRAAREAAYRFMTAIAGDLPGFEEAARALFADERQRFEGFIDAWPVDVRNYLQALSAGAWGGA